MADVTLRRATLHDALYFYALRLDRETQRFVPDPAEQLTLEAHVRWFLDHVTAACWWVGEVAGDVERLSADHTTTNGVQTRVGVLRLDNDAEARPWVSVAVEPPWRGIGAATQMLQLSQLALARWAQTSTFQPIYARIHMLNAPSIRAFERAGFTPDHAYGPWRCYVKGV